MRKNLLLLLAATLLACLAFQQATAQDTSPYWSQAGNSNASASSKLGTTTAVDLKLYTNNSARLSILAANGYVGVGTTAPTSRFTINTATGTSALRASIAGATKLYMSSTGGLSVGSGTSAPANGLYVVGDVGIGTTAPQARLHFNTATATPLLRGTVDGITKLYMSSTGGLTIGSGVAAPGNGLYVAGNAGTGTNTPASPLDVVSPSATYVIQARSTYSGTNYKTAISGYSVNAPGWGAGVEGTGGHRGVYGVAASGTFTNSSVGVYGYATGSAGVGQRFGVLGSGYNGASVYGVYGAATGGSSFNAAGYFNGSLWAVGPLNNISDRKFEQDIQPVAHGLEQVLKLKPSVYTFKTNAYKGMHLPEGKQLGLIADEVRAVFPELVQQAVHPAEYDEEDRTKVIHPEVTYEGVNYQGLIPVLIASIQELKAANDMQQQQIEKQQQQLADLTALVNKLSNSQTQTIRSAIGYLEQNTPNPVKGTTTIRYHIAETSTSARLALTNAKGQVLKTVSLGNRGTGLINLNTHGLAAGNYHYTLHVNGRQVDSKQLVITR